MALTAKEQAILDCYTTTQSVQDAGGANRDNVAIAAAPLSIEALLAMVPADKVAGFLSTQFQDFAKAFMESSAHEQKGQMIQVLGAMSGNPQKSDLIQAIKYLVDTDSRSALKAFLDVLEADGKIATATNTTIAAEIDATIDQPNYQATIANPNRQFVTAQEVQNALN